MAAPRVAIIIPARYGSTRLPAKPLIKLEGKHASGMLKLNEFFEDHDDVQSVYSNFDIDDSEIQE